MDALTLHRIQFSFTITFHYLFPQLTMGLALLIVVLKTMALRTKDERYSDAARFWATSDSSGFPDLPDLPDFSGFRDFSGLRVGCATLSS